MLNFFNILTDKINNIINKDAHSKMNDKSFLEKEILKWLNSSIRKDMIIGKDYYKYEQLINENKRMVIGANGMLVENAILPNNKIIDNVYAKMVDQKVNYLLSSPLTFVTHNDIYNDLLENIFNMNFHRIFKNLGKNAYIGGISWLYIYYDEKGKFKFKIFPAEQILPFWKDEEHTELDFAIRVYFVEGYEGESEIIITKVEVYQADGIYYFIYDKGQLIPDVEAGIHTNYFYVNRKGYNWDMIPLIPFKANNKEIPLIKKVKCLQDGLNKILSDFANSMEENASGNSILIIKNYAGENLGEFRHQLAQYRAVKVETVDNIAGDVTTLEIIINSENYKAIIEIFKKAIIENCRGYDINELKSSGSPNEMTIKAVFSDIDLDANETETEFQASLEQLMFFVNSHLANMGFGNFENENLEIIFNRDMVINESQVIEDIKNSVGLLSNETLIAQHPYIKDVKAEIKRIENENQKQQEKVDLYSNAFNYKSQYDKHEELSGEYDQ